jgi:hypothetical protein
MFRNASARFVGILTASLLAAAPTTLQAQKALVYCPVGIDASGCNAIVTALNASPTSFPDGVDGGYDGSQGTVDLATADLSAYAVFVVPSLADGAGTQPYGLLRDATIAARLQAAFMGRVAVWSGTPDVGSTNRSAKDGLIRNLAKWAKPDSAGTHGPGVVVLQDNSDDATARYGWLGSISSMSVAADTTFDVYSNVQVLTTTGQTILTNSGGLQIGYTNMASYGLVRGAGATASDDATGGRTSRVVLVTAAGEPSDPNIATVRTDKEDYQPGDTVLVTGSGWQPGETVNLLFHEDADPPIHPDKTLTAVADSDGHIVNHEYDIDELDLNIRFTVQATGLTSGKTAQTTFTDAVSFQSVAVGTQAPTPIAPASSATYAITVAFNGNNTPTCSVALSVTTALPSGVTASFSPTSVASPGGANQTSTLTMSTTGATPTGSTSFTVQGVGTACTGTKTATGTLDIKRGSTTTVSGPASSNFGESVIFTATVTGSGPTAPGTVQFKDGAANLGSAQPLASGTASISTSALTTGSHTITAVYSGDAGYTGSTSSSLTHAVNKSNTTTALSSSVNPSVFGQGITLTATVTAIAPGSGTPSGTVQFQIDGSNFGSAVALNGSGVATSGSNSILTVGTHSVAAIYAGNTNYNGSTSTVIATQTINQAGTSTALASSVNPSTFGQAVTFTATVTAVAPGAGTRTGTVQFQIDGSSFGSPVSINASGVATSGSISSLTVGSHPVAAVYSGDANFTTSTSTVIATQTVNAATSTTTLTSSANPSVFGQSVTLTATVKNGATPITVGNVSFIEGGTCASPATTLQANQAVSGSGVVTYASAAFSVAAHSIVACYDGSGGFAVSQATLTQTVNKAATTSTITLDSPDPSNIGQAVTVNYAIAVTTPGAGTPTGNVTVTASGGAETCTGTVAAGTCSITLNASGARNLTATYAGDGSFNGSASAATAHTVNASATSLAVSPATGNFGGTAALSATLTSGGNPVAGKSVAFTLNGTAAGSATTNASGVASIASANLGVINAGTYPTGVGASFAGDASFATSSGTAALTVNPKATTLTLTTVPATVVYGGSALFTAKLSEAAGHTINFTINGTAVGSATTNGGGNVSVTVNFSSFPAIGAEAHNVTATFAGETNLATSSDTKSFTVTQAAATVALSNLAQTYDGSPKSATVTTTPAGLTTSVTYTGSATAPTNGGSYAVVATITDPNYSGSASGTLVIAKATQTITFAPLGNKTFGDAPFIVSATSTSGLAVSFAVGASDKCTIAGSTVTLTGAGSCTVTASQAGDGNYNAAAPVPQSFTISAAAATVTLNGLNQTYDGTPRVVTATTSPTGLTVAITYDASATAPTNAGSYAIVGTINDPNYTGTASGTLVVAKADQTITFAALTDKTLADPDVTVSATATSSLAVSFAASGSCTATGNSVHLTAAGSCTVTASQAGNANYNAAPNVDQSFTIAKGQATLALSDLSHTYDGTPKSATVTTAPVGLTGVSVTYDGSATAPSNAGSYAVVASLNNANYEATDATGTLVIAKAEQAINFAALSPKAFGDAPFSVSATGGGSGNAVTFSSTTPATCSVAGSTVTLEAAGSCTIAADQAGNANYEAAPQVTQSFTITKGAATLALSDLSHTYDGTPKSATVTTTPSGLTVVSVTYNGSATAPTNAGSYAVVVSLTNANYDATDATGTLVIAKATQTITFAALAARTFGEPDFSVSATATSTLSVTFAASGNCTVAGSSVHLTGAGSCTITASQAGNQNYEAATDVEQSFSIAKASQTIVFAPLSPKTFGDAPFALSAAGGASGNAIAFASTTPSSCSVAGNTVTIEHAGSCTITANQASNDDYDMAAEVSQSFTIAKAAATLTLSDLTHTYDGSPKAATVTVTPSGLTIVSVTYDGSPTAPTNAGSYAVVASLSNADYDATDATGILVINKAAQTITFAALADKTFGDPDVPLSASASSGLAITFTPSGNCSVVGASAQITGAGSCTITASQAGNANYATATDVSHTFAIAKATATVVLNGLTQTYDGTPRVVTETTTPAGLTVDITYDGSATAPTNAGSYAIAASVNDPNYEGSSSGTLVVSKAAQTITFAALADKTFGDPDFSVSATATSSLGVSFAASGKCTVAGSSVTLTGAGSCTITASQTGDGNYEAATDVAQSFTINKAAATLVLSDLIHTYDGSPKAATVTVTPSGLSGVSVTYDGSAAAPTNAGSYAVVATLTNDDYEATAASGTLVINKAVQAIAFTQPSDKTFGDAPFGLSATGGASGNAVVFASTTPGTCSVAGSTATIVHAGSCTITANQAGNANYEAAGEVTRTFTINKAAASLALSDLTQTYDGSPKSATVTTSPAGLSGVSVTYDASPTAPTSAGSYAAVASLTNDDYQATDASGTLVIEKANQTITFAPLADKTFGDPDFALSASVSSSLTITFAASGNCSVAGSTAHITGAGSCTITASQAGDANFNPASDVDQSFTITKAPAAVVLNGLTQTYDGTPRVVAATTTPAGLTVDITYDGSATAPTNAGSYAIAASVNDPNYQGSTAGTLVVSKANQTIAFAALADKTFGDPDFGVSATATSSLGVSFAASGKCTVTGSTVHLTGAGSCDITASQAGDGNYNAAPDVIQSFSIAKASQTLAFAALTDKIFGDAPFGLSATGGASGNAVVFASTIPGICSVTGTTATILHAGGCTITANQAGNSDYDAASVVSRSFTINKAPATLALSALTHTYSATPKSATVTTTPSGLSGVSVTYNGSGTAPTNAGSYAVVASLTNQDYQATDASGTLVINQAPLTITADNQTRIYGVAAAAFTVGYSGFVGSEGPSALGGTLAFTGTATTAINVGSYVITPGGLTSANYAIAFADGTLEITTRAVAVTADSKTKVYGDIDPALTYQLTSGTLAYSDAFSGALARLAGETVAASPYTINQGNLTLNANYALTFNPAALAITKKALTVVADNKSKLYGVALPTLTGTLTGVVSGDNITATYTAGAGGIVTASTDVGLYDIIPVLSDPNGKLANYTVTSTNGKITITKAPLTVTADAKTRQFGAGNPAFTATITGFVLGQSSSVVTGAATFSGAGPTAGLATPVGTYAITPAAGSLSATNYTFLSANGATFVNGQLNITQATSTTTAAAVSAPYSELSQNVTLTATVTGSTPPAVGEGTVKFTLKNGAIPIGSPVTVPVSGGAASANYTVPAMTDVGNYSILAEYTSGGNYVASNNTGTLTIQPANLEDETATTDADFRHVDGVDALFKKDGNLTTLRLQNTNPGTVHYQLTLKNITGVVIDAATGSTARTILEVPSMTSCGSVNCPSSVDKTAPAWILKAAKAVHVRPDDRTDDMPVQLSYKASGTCADESTGYTTNLASIPGGAPKCIRVMGYAIPKRERARLDIHFEFRWKDTGGWSSSPDSKLYFRSGFAFKSTTTVNFSVAPSIRTSIDAAGLVVAGQRVTAMGGFAFNTAGVAPVGYTVRAFNLQTDASCTIAVSDPRVVAQDVISADGFYFIWKKGTDQMNTAAAELPSNIKYYLQMCNGVTPVTGHSVKNKLVDKEFDEEDFDL